MLSCALAQRHCWSTEGVPQGSGAGHPGERYGAERRCSGDAKSQESLRDPEPGL